MASSADDANLARESILSLSLSKTNRTHWTAAAHSGNTHGRGHHGPLLDAGVGFDCLGCRLEIIAAWVVAALVRQSCRMRLDP